MYEILKTVEISNYQMPIRCNINVLCALQDGIGSCAAFQQKLIGMKRKKDSNGEVIYKANGEPEYVMGEPNIEVIRYALPLMIKEGIRKANEQDEEVPDFDWMEAIEAFDFDYIAVAIAMNEEYTRCFHRKKKTNLKDTATKKVKK